jgi:hypothetical protein
MPRRKPASISHTADSDRYPADRCHHWRSIHAPRYAATTDPTRGAHEQARARSERTRGANPRISAHIGYGVCYEAPRIVPPVAQARESKSPNFFNSPRVHSMRKVFSYWQRPAEHGGSGAAGIHPTAASRSQHHHRCRPSLHTHTIPSVPRFRSGTSFRNLHLLDGHDPFAGLRLE